MSSTVAPAGASSTTAHTSESTSNTGCWSAHGCEPNSENGEQFYAKAGEQIALPARRVDWPHREFPEWHLDTTFKAA